MKKLIIITLLLFSVSVFSQERLTMYYTYSHLKEDGKETIGYDKLTVLVLYGDIADLEIVFEKKTFYYNQITKVINSDYKGKTYQSAVFKDIVNGDEIIVRFYSEGPTLIKAKNYQVLLSN